MTTTPPAKFVRHEVREIEGRLVVVFIRNRSWPLG